MCFVYVDKLQKSAQQMPVWTFWCEPNVVQNLEIFENRGSHLGPFLGEQQTEI